ncbi:hypothetical protein ACNF49_40685 [Actinomadura sp. ATCC 39365]
MDLSIAPPTVQRLPPARPGRDWPSHSMVLPFAGDSRVAELQIEILDTT